MSDKGNFSKREVTTLLLWLLGGAIGLTAFVTLYSQAFPEASIDFKITRTQALDVGRHFLKRHGFDVRGYRSAVEFSWDDDSKTYLEKELGLQVANRLMRRDVNVWYWNCRYFKAEQLEEFSLSIDPGGRVVGFWHTIEETRKGANLKPAAARALAEDFLKREPFVVRHGTEWSAVPCLDLRRYRLVETNSSKELKRTDHTFTWERKGFKAKDATYRVWVTIQGNRVGGYSEFLKIPERWEREQEKKQAPRDVLSSVAWAFHGLVTLSAFFVLLYKLWKRQVRTPFAVVIGLVLAVMGAAGLLNAFPLMWTDYETTDSLGAFVTRWVFNVPLLMMGTMVAIFLLTLPAEAVYRDTFPDKAPLPQSLNRRFWVSKEFLTAATVGYCLALLDLGYVTVFYVLGWKVGVWAPQDIPYDDSVATVIPWIYPMLSGAFPAVDEEFTYRLFATSLLLLWTRRQFIKHRVPVLTPLVGFFKRPWFAVVAPAVIWGFLHVGYPQEPFYIRGIEVALSGILWGCVFVRYGIVSTVVAHYTVNAVMSSTLLLRASHPYLKLSGILVCALMLLPLIPAAFVALRRKRLVSTEELWAQEKPAVQERPQGAMLQTPVSWSYCPLTLWRIAFLVTLAVGGLSIFLGTKAERFGDFVKVSVNRKEALQIADDFLRMKGVAIDRFVRVATFSDGLGGDDADYVYEHKGFKALNPIFRDRLPSVFWGVRYFVPMQKEESTVWMTPDGQVFTYNHLIEEDAQGANLTETQARRKAEASLRERGVRLSDWKLMDTSSKKRKRRTDHWFTWEDRKTKIDEGRFRLSLKVQGNEVLNYSRRLKTPEKWERKREEQTVKDAVLGGVGSIIGMTIGILFLWLFLRTLASGQVNWMFALKAAGVMTALMPVGLLNNLTTFWSGYDTTQPIAVFLSLNGLGWVFGLIGGFVGTFLFVAFAETLFRQAFPHLPPIPQWLKFRPERAINYATTDTDQPLSQPPNQPTPRLVWRDALLLAVTLALLSLGMNAVTAAFDAAGEPLHPFGEVEAPTATIHGGYTEWCPAVSAVEELCYAVVFGGLALAVAAAIYRRYVKRMWRLYLLLLVLSLLAAGEEAKTWGEFGVMAGGISVALVIILLIVWGFWRAFLRENLYAYVAIVVFDTLLSQGVEMLKVPDEATRLNGVGVLGVLALLALLMVWVSRRSGAAPPSKLESDATPPPASSLEVGGSPAD